LGDWYGHSNFSSTASGETAPHHGFLYFTVNRAQMPPYPPDGKCLHQVAKTAILERKTSQSSSGTKIDNTENPSIIPSSRKVDFRVTRCLRPPGSKVLQWLNGECRGNAHPVSNPESLRK
jgi:hypothetical protein